MPLKNNLGRRLGG